LAAYFLTLMCCLCFAAYTIVLVIVWATHSKYFLFAIICNRLLQNYKYKLLHDYLQIMIWIHVGYWKFTDVENYNFYGVCDIILLKSVFFSVTGGKPENFCGIALPWKLILLSSHFR
jgi:hypothetical protein